MAMQDEIRELTVNLLQSTVDASLVTAVCVGTEQFLTRRLRKELTPADCHDVFVLAAAMLSLACLNLMASEGLEQFQAGTMRLVFDRSNDKLSAAARELIAPYCQGSTAFVGVRA